MIDRSRLLERLQNVRRIHDQQYQASCPAHRDSEPSLSVTFTDERILLHCFAGCSTDAIVAALGLEWRDLFASPGDSSSGGGETAKRRSGETAGGSDGAKWRNSEAANGMAKSTDPSAAKRPITPSPQPVKPITGGRLRGLVTPVAFGEILAGLNWPVLWHFLFKKTIPFFWIPAHTVTFLLPPEYQIVFAALLGIVLGVLLEIAEWMKR